MHLTFLESDDENNINNNNINNKTKNLMEIKELKNEKINKFDEVKPKRQAFDFFERNEIEKIIDEGSLTKKTRILEEARIRWSKLNSDEQKEFKKLEKLDEKRVKSEAAIKKKFEEIKAKFLSKNDSEDSDD